MERFLIKFLFGVIYGEFPSNLIVSKTLIRNECRLALEINFMPNQDEKKPVPLISTQWGKIKGDLEELERLYINLKQGKDQSSFEYELIAKAKESDIDVEQYRKIFKEYYTDKRLLKNLDNWLEETSFFSLIQRFTTLIGVVTLVVSAITFLPTQQGQRRTELSRKQIEQDRANYEAWGIINGNRVDSDGNLIQASSGRITALQNLKRNRVPLQGLEIPEAFLLNIDLGGADLYRANFQGADLYRANFSSRPAQTNPWICSWAAWTQLMDCQSKEDLQKWRTDLERVNFRGAILFGTKFNDQGISDGDNSEPNVDLFRGDFSPFYRGKGNQGKPFNKASDLAIECFSEKPTIQCTRAVNAEFIGANLKSADFTKANLKGANFKNANLECTSFRGAIFNSVKGIDPNLPEGVYPTNFEGANLKGADLRDLASPTSGDKTRDLSAEQIKKAKNWQEASYSPSLLKELGLLGQSHKPFICPTFDKELSR
jgi:uncharacterized protein YjbI with pentapeptide repeats